MNIKEHWRLAITPLSPVHMGAGQDYEPTGYVIDDGTLWEFDSLAALRVLPAGRRKALNSLLDGHADDGMLRQVQNFFFENRDRLIGASRHQVLVPSNLEAFYRNRVGKVVQQEERGRGGNVHNALVIERTAWSPGNGEAILPGSGLKGAIRTALLDSLNRSQALREGRAGDEGSNELQQRLFQYSPGRFERDPMRMVNVADAALTADNEFNTEIRFALNRKKKSVFRNGQLMKSQAESLYQILECIPAWRVRAFEGNLLIQGTGGIENQDWPTTQFSVGDIAKACNRFYRAHLDRERSMLKDRGYVDQRWNDRLDALLDGAASAMEASHAFLLRVGRHSGAESVTLNDVRKIKSMKGRGERPEDVSEAKTIWLAGHATDARSDLLPFGWLLIEPFQHSSDLFAWNTPDSGTTVANWREKNRERIAKVTATLSSELREAEALRKKADAIATLAAQETARLAAMSPEEIEIEAIRKIFETEKKAGPAQPGSLLANRRVGLLNQAKAWASADMRRMAADLIEETVRWLSWPKQKKAERSKEIDELRGK